MTDPRNQSSERILTRRQTDLVADFLGLPRQPDDRIPPDDAFSRAIDRVLERNRIGIETPELALQEQWENIVGPLHAHHCWPLRINTRQFLLIATSNPVVRQDLFFRRRELLRKVQQLPGCSGIRDLRLSSV
ncbi:MAG: DUF721 domain-containing protein [Puniceicoccaceae bacterium]|nr:MAG: DUF721 domain-containing protein [Puniceicoccaceae bacterium]